MEKKELTVRDLIRKLLEFNMDATVTINLTGVPFPLYSDFSLWYRVEQTQIEMNCYYKTNHMWNVRQPYMVIQRISIHYRLVQLPSMQT